MQPFDPNVKREVAEQPVDIQADAALADALRKALAAGQYGPAAVALLAHSASVSFPATYGDGSIQVLRRAACGLTNAKAEFVIRGIAAAVLKGRA